MGLLGSGGAVGLELDTVEARAVELRGKAGAAGAATLTAWGRVSLPPGAVVDGMVSQPELVGKALAELWSAGRITSREVVLGVVNREVLVRFAVVPVMPRTKLFGVIRHHARDLLPIPLDTAVWDYTVIGERPGLESRMFELLLVAARREMLDGFLLALAFARLEPRDIDVASLALLRVMPPSPADGAIVLVDLGNGSSTVLVIARGMLRLARFVSVSLEAAAGMLGCSVEEALAGPGGTAHRQWPAETLAAWAGGVEAEIRASVDYYQRQEPEPEAVSEVVLSGRGVRVPGLTTQLEGNLGVPVRIIEPLQGITLPAGIAENSSWSAPDFATCIGLARRGLEGGR